MKLTKSEIQNLVKRIDGEEYHLFGPYVKFEDDGTVGLIPAYPTDRKYKVLTMYEFLVGEADEEEKV